MKKNSDFRKNTILLTLGTIINKGLQFAVIPFFSKWLTTEEYGRFDLIVTYVSLLIPIITLSNHEGIFRMCIGEIDQKNKSGYITGGFLIDVIDYLIFVLFLYYFYGRYNINMFIAFILYLFGEVALVYLRGVLRAMKKLDIYSFVLIFSTLIMVFFVTLFVKIYNMGLNGILIGYAIGSTLGAFFVAFMVRWWKWISVSCVKKNQIREILSYSAPLIPNDLSWWVINASDRQIINIFFGDTANGIYAIAHKIPAICSIIFSMVSISWQQEVSTSIEAEQKIDINNYLNAMIKILVSFCVCLLAGSFILYYYIFDNKYFDASKYSPILIVSSGVLAISLFMGGILAAYKRTKSNGFSTVIGAGLNIIIHLVFLRIIGLYAAALSTLIANIITLLIRILSLRDVYKVKIDKISYVSIGIMTYFIICAYFNENMIFNVVNLLIAFIIALALNKKLILDVFYGFKRRGVNN